MADLDTVLSVVQDIKDQLDDVDLKCTELLQFKAVHAETHKSIDSSMATFKRTLFGDNNGTGLTYKIEKLMQCKNSLKSAADRWQGFWIGVLRTLATAAIIAVTAWLLCLYRDHGPTGYQRPETTQPGSSQGP